MNVDDGVDLVRTLSGLVDALGIAGDDPLGFGEELEELRDIGLLETGRARCRGRVRGNFSRARQRLDKSSGMPLDVRVVERSRVESLSFRAITTSLEMSIACAELGVPTTNLLDARPDWSFDGADEVDGDANMIKGRGGAMLREKLLLASSPERYILIDESKRVSKLGEKARVPVEVIPEALQLVQAQLAESFDIRDVELRMAIAKDGPVVTEHGNVILEVHFADVTAETDIRVNCLPGVAASGLFFGFAPTIVSA